MSKSYGNTINLSDTEPVVRQKLKTMVTDPARVRRNDPGNPDVCPVFDFHKIFSPLPVIEQVNTECRTAAIGCIDSKKLVADRMVERLTPLWEARRSITQDPARLEDAIREGSPASRSGRPPDLGRSERRDEHMISAQHGIAGSAPSVEREEVRMNVLTRQAVLAITSLAVIVSGCGTLMHSDKQSVTIFSLPPGANVIVNRYLHVAAPGTVSLQPEIRPPCSGGRRKATRNRKNLKFGGPGPGGSWATCSDALVIFSPFCIYKDVHEGGFYTLTTSSTSP